MRAFFLTPPGKRPFLFLDGLSRAPIIRLLDWFSCLSDFEVPLPTESNHFKSRAMDPSNGIYFNSSPRMATASAGLRVPGTLGYLCEPGITQGTKDHL